MRVGSSGKWTNLTHSFYKKPEKGFCFAFYIILSYFCKSESSRSVHFLLLLKILKQVVDCFRLTFSMDLFGRFLNTRLFYYIVAIFNKLFYLDVFDRVLNVPVLRYFFIATSFSTLHKKLFSVQQTFVFHVWKGFHIERDHIVPFFSFCLTVF